MGKRINWDKASLPNPDPARALPDKDILAPDDDVVTTRDLTHKEKRKIAKKLARVEAIRKEHRKYANEKKRKRKRVLKAVFEEDAIRESRLKAASDLRKAARENTAILGKIRQG